ncbi:RabGAP/TBC, partial [Linderina pennispora]
EVSSVQLVYAKSKVYIYRSAHKKDRVSGFVCIVQGPDSQYYIAWTPEALLSEHDRESYDPVKPVSLSMMSDDDSAVLVSTGPLSQGPQMTSISSYAFCKPVGELASLLIHPPSLTQWYGSVILNLRDGSSLAPLWFHDDESASTLLGMTRHWGGDELLVWLAHAIDIARAPSDPNLYIMRQSKSPHVTLSTATSPSASGVLPRRSTDSNVTADGGQTSEARTAAHGDASQERGSSTPDVLDSVLHGNMDPLMGQVKELQWGILERFARITRTVRDAATSLVETPVARQVLPYMPPSLGGDRASAAGSLAKEYEGARIYLAKWAAQHIIQQQHEDGQRESQKAAGGASTDVQPHSIWEEWVAESGDLGRFQVVSTDKTANLPAPIRTRPALSAEQWFGFFEATEGGPSNPERRLVADPDTVRRAIFAGGVEEDIRPVVWKYLLKIHPWSSTEADRTSIDKANADQYWILKDKWLSDPQLKNGEDYIEQQSRIEKDVLRTDRALPLFATDSTFGGNDESNLAETGLPGSSASLEQMKDILMTFHYYDEAELGYVQGMSDLLAPIYSVFQDEPTTFWAFTHFMQRMRPHFLRDQSGMQDELTTISRLVEIANPPLHKHLAKYDAENMFCCYRWLLIWFKREFSFEDVLRLWEVLWTDYLTDRFVLFVALAVLQRHADVIMDHLESPEDILKYVQDLSETIDLNDALKGAETSFYIVRHRVAVVEQKRREHGLA